MLSRNALFRRENGELIGAVVYNTDYNDRWYIIHSISDENLLGQMIEYVTEADGNTAIIKANLNDTILCRLLVNAGFDNQNLQSVLEIDLSHNGRNIDVKTKINYYSRLSVCGENDSDTETFYFLCLCSSRYRSGNYYSTQRKY